MKARGQRRRFPRNRLTVLEIIQAAKSVPAFPLETTIPVAKIEAARKAAGVRIGWTAIFAKAFAKVCEENDQLRETFISLPFASLYQHPTSVCSVSVHRKDDAGADRLIWGRIESASSKSLVEIQQYLNDCVSLPLTEVYREGLLLERTWCFVRKIAWWWIMRCSGRKKSKLIGTFSISSLGGKGCLNSFHPLITTSSIAFGPIDQQGGMRVVLICDHRVLDGMAGAAALQSLANVMQTSILEELGLLANSLRRAS
jgi:pyruvate/2-oxoglutarate dehydrogenase complex dihydrolipoamide acyltransferase (E2) component